MKLNMKIWLCVIILLLLNKISKSSPRGNFRAFEDERNSIFMQSREDINDLPANSSANRPSGHRLMYTSAGMQILDFDTLPLQYIAPDSSIYMDTGGVAENLNATQFGRTSDGLVRD